MEDNQENESLYIPQGIKKKREYFSGYGKYELYITLVSVFIASIICFLIYTIFRNLLLAVFLILVIPFTTVLYIAKNDSNISVVDEIRFMVRFMKDQKKYLYVYQDEWLV